MLLFLPLHGKTASVGKWGILSQEPYVNISCGDIELWRCLADPGETTKYGCLVYRDSDLNAAYFL